MDFEKMLLFGVGAFGFMALAQMWRTMTEAKRLRKRKGHVRPRRLVGTERVARQLAKSLLGEVAQKNGALVDEARQGGDMGGKLDKQIKAAMNHYMDRVHPRFKGLFYEEINNIIFGREPEK